MRPGAGGGSGSHRLRPHERTGPAPRGGSSGAGKWVVWGGGGGLGGRRRLGACPTEKGSDMRIQDISSFSAVKEAGLAKLLPNRPRIAVGLGGRRRLGACPTEKGSDMRIQDISSFSAVKEAGLAKLLPNRPRIAVGM